MIAYGQLVMVELRISLNIPTDSGSLIVLGICFAALITMLVYFGFRMVEMAYVMKHKKPLYNHKYFKLRKLTESRKNILKNDFTFYRMLSPKEQTYFEHRVASLIIDKRFIGRGGFSINDEAVTLISATAAMLTFGFRNFYIGLINKIIVYPESFYSNISKQQHKGEFNPQFGALVLSWDDFKKGWDKESDKINLGIHEFTHAIHLNSIKEKDVSSTIFGDSFKELIDLLSNNEVLRKDLINSNYFRSYAYTNQYEFIAAVIESFIESPSELRSQFPEVYNKVRQMLNFNFAGY